MHLCHVLWVKKCCLPFQQTKDAAATSSHEGTQDGDEQAAHWPALSHGSYSHVYTEGTLDGEAPDTGPGYKSLHVEITLFKNISEKNGG